jgi:hypothetical protein
MRSALLASLAAVALAAGGMTAASAVTAHRSGAPSASPKDSKYPDFKGIYAFSGGHSSDLASNPDVAGRSLVYYWAQLEPQKGQYNWDLVDQDMKPWVDAGKKVILRVSAAGQTKWDKDADSAHGTPKWVYDQGVKSVTEQDKAVLPQYWNPTFEQDYDDFIKAFAARYDGSANVAFIDASVGIGGETKPDSENNKNILSLWQSIGYTDDIWWGYVQNAISTYRQAFTKTPVTVMPDKTFLGSTNGYNEQKTLDYAVAQGAWLQDNGLGTTWPLKGEDWHKTTLIGEQRRMTSESGDKLIDDFQTALDNDAAYIMAFTDDLQNPANAQTIHQVAAEANPDPTGPPTTPPPPPPPSGSDQTLWDGDWSTYNWEIHAGGDWGNSTLEKVAAPGGRPGVAGKFTVNTTKNAQDERAEATATQKDTGGNPGDEAYYEWWTYVPSDPNKKTGWSSDWTDITQWMDTRANCSPPEQIDILPGANGPQLVFDNELNNQKNPCDYSQPEHLYTLGDLQYDTWQHFDVHLKFSTDPKVGFAEIWLNGKQVLPLTHMQTLDDNSKGVYMEQALYRADMKGTNVLYHAGTRRHTQHTDDGQ